MTKKGKYNSPWQATLQGIRDMRRKDGEAVRLAENPELSNKIVMITGASSGLGWATAQRCARAGATVLMVNRSGFPEKVEELKRISGNTKVHGYKVDLSDLDQVVQLLDTLDQDNVTIDLLISNAAMVPLKSRTTAQDLEEMFAVNYLAGFFLMRELVARNRFNTEEPSRIIIVSSESHRNPEDFKWDEFGKYSPYSIKETVARYGYFKLLLTTFAAELSERLSESNLSVRSLCPGPVNSNIAREAPGWMQPLLKLSFSLFFRSPEKASDPVIYFATEDWHSGRDFEYLFLMRKKQVDEKCTDEQNRARLWELSEQLLRDKGYKLTTW